LLDFETSTSHDITVRATSSDTSFSTASFSIAVSDVAVEGPPPPTVVAVEAEDLARSANYRLQTAAVASGGELIGIRLPAEGGLSTDQATATLDNFTGASGLYNVGITYFNENDGASLIEVLVNGTVAGSFIASAPSSSASVAAGNRVTQTLTGIAINTGDDVAIRGTRNLEEYARIDNLLFTQTAGPSGDPIGPVTDSNAATNAVAEGAANGTAVGVTALATDPDGSAGVSYSLDANAGGRFAINATTGVVTVANGSLLDFETSTSHDITVRATSSRLTAPSPRGRFLPGQSNELDIGAD
jgi:hypothetical protein